MSAAVAQRRPRRVRTATRLAAPAQSSCPLAQVGFEGSRHQIPDRLPSARGERTVSMRVIELNEDTLDNIRAVGDSLKRLDLSNVGLREIDDELIRQLPVLERLDLSRNLITEDGLPASLGQLERLVELSVHDNQMGSVPKVVQRMKNLSRLKLGANHIKSAEGLEKLRRLTMLILDDNEISAFGRGMYSALKRLEYLHCSGNHLHEVPPEVRLWRHLKDLNLSNNELTYLPPEVFLLPRIDVLNASSNKISRLPSMTVKGKVKRMLALVDLSDNLLVKFPDYLLMMTHKLDLSRNRIRVVPGSIIKKLDYGTEQVLHLSGNPLTNPPRDVCECGIRCIIQYFQEVRAEIRVHQGLKVLALGESKAGKTSLVQTMVDGQSRLSEKTDRTVLVDLYEAEYDLDEEGPTGRKLQLALWDFSGHPAYLYPASIFLHQPSLVMLVFNMAAYKEGDFQKVIGRWIDWVLVRKNKLVALIVGTHADKIKTDRIQAVCADVSKAVSSYIQRYRDVISREIQKIESLPHISPALSEQLKVYINLLKVQITIHPQVVPVSSASLLGLGDLQKAIINLAEDKKTFPHVLRVIPSLWVEVENYIDEKAWTLQVPLVRWNDYVEDIVKRFGMKHLIEQITSYLHETGRVLWFSDHPQLRDYIILRPTWLADLLKAVFKHDMTTNEFSQDEVIKLSGFNQARLEKCRAELVDEGIIDKELLRYIWAHYIPPDNIKVLHEMAHLFVEFFEIGYVVDRPDTSGRASALSLSSERSAATTTPLAAPTPRSLRSRTRSRESVAAPPSTTTADPGSSASAAAAEAAALYPFSRILIPWLRETPQPAGFRQDYECFADHGSLVANFRFPRHIPAGFFETLTVRAQRAALGLTTMYHWRGGLYARHADTQSRLYMLRIDHEADRSTCVRLEARRETPHGGDDGDDVETLWSMLLPFLRETDALIAKFSGVRVERHMECPKCHALAFLGEWQTPKELQGVSSRVCESCKVEVSSRFLIQPKEKKKVEEFLRRRILEQQQRRLSAISLSAANDVAKKLDGIKEENAAHEERQREETHSDEDPANPQETNGKSHHRNARRRSSVLDNTSEKS